MKDLRLGIFLALKDMLNNIGSLLFISAALGFLFANVLFSRFVLYGFEKVIGGLIPKVSGHVYINPLRGESYIFNTNAVLSSINDNQSIKYMSPVLEMPCVLEYKESRIVTMVWGVDYDENVMDLESHIIDGRYFSNASADEIILGKILLKRFKQKISGDEEILLGDSAKCIFIKEHNIDKFNKEVYRDKFCKIAGVADMRDYIANNAIFMPLEALRNNTLLYNRATSLFIRLKDGKEADTLELESFAPSNMAVEAKHWRDRDDYGTDDLVYGFNIISVVTFMVSIICAAILVAFVIYFNTQKKRQETGILRAIGIKDNVFLIFFIIEGMLFSIIGVIVGSGIYYGLERYLYNHPIVMPFGDLYPIFEIKSYIFATALFITVSFAASVYHAIKSSRENIIKIVRGD